MITGLEIALLISVLVAFLWNSVAFTIHAAMLKSLLMRVESCEHKLRQIPIPGVEDEFVNDGEIDPDECLHPNHPEACAYPEFVDDGEIGPDDDSYSLSTEIRDSRKTNSNGIPIARKSDVDSPE